MAVGFPAKTTYANGDVFSASDINDTNGTLNLVNPATTGTVQSNPLLNSAFQIWQRGTSFAISNSIAYTADRWQGRVSAACTTSFSRQTTSDTTNLPNIQYAARVQRSNAQIATPFLILEQSMETVNSIPFAGKTVTMSFYARRGANFSGASNSLSVFLITGTGTDQNVGTSGYTGSTNAIASSATLTTTWQRFTYTATLAATTTEIATQFYYVATGVAGAADFFEITGVQIDIGSVALPFRTYAGTIQGELAACQRYYFRATASSVATSFGVGANYSTSASQIHVNHPVQMRIGPASIDYSTLAVINSTGGFVTFTTLTLSFTGPLTSMLGVTGASGLVAGYANILLANNSTSGYLGFSAEL
jgi:hypothetical protein